MKPREVPGLKASTSLSRAGAKLIAARLRELQRSAAAAQRACGAEAVHDARVAIRRLRAAFALFGKRRLREESARLRPLKVALGNVRDSQLRVAWLARHQATFALEEERRRLAEEERGLRAALGAFDEAARSRIESRLGEVRAKGKLGGARLRKRLAKRLPSKALVKEARTLEPSRIHALRIALKKLRYRAELVAASGKRKARTILELSSRLQDPLGALHDADVRVEQLERRRGRAPREAALEQAWLVRSAKEERSRLARAASRRLRKFHHKALRKLRRALR